jgi:hypothetical protein
MKVEMKLEGLNGVLETLKSLPPDVVSKNGGVVRKAVLSGARVIKKQAMINLRAVTAGDISTGLTAMKVIAARKKRKDFNSERYIVSVKYEDHPVHKSKFKKKPIKFNDISFMLEYGTKNQPAEPWMRPAFSSKAEEATKKIETSLLKEIDKVVKKLAKQNAGKK